MNHKLLYIFLILFSFGKLTAEILYLRDGRIIKNITNVKDAGFYFLITINNQSKTYSKQKIDKITSNSGNIIFEHKIMTAEKIEYKTGLNAFVFYLNGKKVGTAGWNSNEIFKVYEGDLPDGIYNLYFNTGKLERIFPIKNNTVNGKVEVYYNSGKLCRTGHFTNGLEEGESYLYYKTGEIKGKSQYRNGTKNGKTTLFYPTGELKAEMFFIDGKINGMQKMYYKSAKISNIVTFKNGMKNGDFKQFYENGNKKITGQTRDGKLNGIITVYYESGKIKKRNNFVNGRILKE